MIRARSMNSSRASSLAMRSSSRWRKRVSTSVRPWCFSGGGRSDLASTAKSSTRRVSSPRLDMNAVPSTPMRSPRSRCSRRSMRSSPSTSTRAWSCRRPLRSTRSRKAILPWPRRAARRPATRCCASVSAPASRPSWAPRTSATGSTPPNSCGNGSMPSERSCSSLARRAASSSSLKGSLHPDGDLGDLELALLAVGEDDLGGVALLVAHQGLAHGRLVRQPLGRAGLGRADDDEGLLLALVVLDVDLRADAHEVGARLAGVEQAGAAQALLELRDARLEHGLLVLGVVVLGVLRDVAELAGFLDALGDLAALRGLEVLQLLLEVLEPFFCEDDVLLHVDRRTPG